MALGKPNSLTLPPLLLFLAVTFWVAALNGVWSATLICSDGIALYSAISFSSASAIRLR